MVSACACSAEADEDMLCVCDGCGEGGFGGEGYAGAVVAGGREECEGEGEGFERGHVGGEGGGERRDGEGEGERGGHRSVFTGGSVDRAALLTIHYSPKLSYNRKWDFYIITQFPAHYSRPPLVRFGPRTLGLLETMHTLLSSF